MVFFLDFKICFDFFERNKNRDREVYYGEKKPRSTYTA